MREWNFYWRSGDRRLHLCIRAWWANPLYALRRWWRAKTQWDQEFFETELRSFSNDNDVCYCPVGITTRFRFVILGVGFWGWLGRDWIERPCPCDEAIANLSTE